MFKLPSRFLIVLVIGCVFFISCAAHSQNIAALPTKRELVKSVLADTGISQRYDLYLGNSIDMAMTPETPNNSKLMAWLKLFVQKEAGWNYAESAYVTGLEAKFSTSELQEILALAKQPVMKKLLQAELDAYVAAGSDRRKRFFQAWDAYNSGQVNIPSEVLR